MFNVILGGRSDPVRVDKSNNITDVANLDGLNNQVGLVRRIVYDTFPPASFLLPMRMSMDFLVGTRASTLPPSHHGIYCGGVWPSEP